MKKDLLAVGLLLCFGLSAQAGSDPSTADKRNEVRFIHNNKRMPDATYQHQLRQQPEWQQFLAAHGTWFVEFNEYNALPHRAYGKPIAVNGTTPEAAALNFIQNELYDFNIPSDVLELTGVSSTEKFHYVHFIQKHEGVKVLFSRTTVKLDRNNRVIMFGSDVEADLELEMIPAISGAAAINAAQQGIAGVTIESTELSPEMFILPIPGDKEYKHHLVYEVLVKTMDARGIPANYQTWVDAHSGIILSRTNLVMHCGHEGHDAEDCDAPSTPAAVSVQVNGDVYMNSPWDPTVTQGMPNIQVAINGTTYNADGSGMLTTGETGPVSATIDLRGPWSSVYTNNNTPSLATTLQDGANTIAFDNDATVRELGAYYHVNIIHDYMKTVIPTFDGMDFSLTTNVDLAGDCNAFYDGSSINFYAEGNDCQSYANIGDVVYHEYGHGINDNFYQDQGGFFQNGAMNEGYADVWGFAPFEDPLLADGQSLSDPDDFIRRYDIDPKVYPVDIVAEVHADGEIIAGAWWDTYLLLGSDMDHTMELFAEHYPGMQAQTANGNEGEAFRDVLIDVLQADDDDADITNGTPNGTAIVEAFAIHGITLISNAEILHTALQAHEEDEDILIEGELTLTFPFTQYLGEVNLYYRLNNDPSIQETIMTNVGGSDFEASIPGQPTGTVVGYYLGAKDLFGTVAGVNPIGAAQEDPNLPYFVLVNMEMEALEDVDDVNQLENWLTGIPGDDASTGEWEINQPIGSFGTSTPFIDYSTAVAPYEQHTPGGELCFLTGVSSAEDAAIGENDVDGGTTTLMMESMDITAYENPVITYWRWYTNSPATGANPGADWWQAYVSDNGGSTWVPIEETKTSDASWRRFAFRVQDYVGITSEFSMKFNVSDSTRLGQNLDGGSLVEGALDDIMLWENISSIGIDEVSQEVGLEVYPNPANNDFNVSFELLNTEEVHIVVLNSVGQEIWAEDRGRVGAGRHLINIDTRSYAEGLYTLDLRIGQASARRKISILR